MKFLIAFLLAVSMLTATGSCCAAQSTATPQHFRWTEEFAHELDYKHTVRTATELTSAEKIAIVGHIFSQMVAMGDLEDLSGPMSRKRIREYAESVRVEMVDLKGDGTRIVLAQAPWIPLCGGTGNCSFWIFEFDAGQMRVLLDLGDFGNGHEKVLVRPWATNGYKDIVFDAHVSATERGLDVFKYRNGKYHPSECYSAILANDPINGPSVSRIKCN